MLILEDTDSFKSIKEKADVEVDTPVTFGKVVTSDVFDIKLMLNLLDALANMEIGDLYPIQSDKSISAMLSRIKFIRNEATQSFEGKLSKDQFNKYWDDIAQTAPEPSLQFLLSNKDSFIVHSVNIPADFSLPNRTRHFEDLTDEENNFLAIVHALNKIVYPLIQDEFNKQCRDNELEKIRTAIYEQPTRCSRDSHSERNISQWTNIYLTQKQKEQLFSPIKEESRNLDLKLMIYILIRKKEEEGKKDYVEQLEVINTIRRDIFQSSSGVLNEGKFKEILKLTTKAIAHFGEEIYGERIELLHHVRNNIGQ
ncbi:unnamed protein product [Mytilus edulis]|uniref:DZIP3-like HEPN domain-containing protein n=1 Tax=Mytilus edulis TaxID=6550 RepID=A0A8S3RYF8_MYTED|nr:unnamed protein product [Mytilus edulis]